MKIKCGQCGEVFADIARAKSHGATTGHDSFEAANDDDATATATAHATNATPVDGDAAPDAVKEDATTRDEASTLKEPSVREDLLQELTELMGFGRNKAVRALYYSKADSAERAIDWIERHEDLSLIHI